MQIIGNAFGGQQEGVRFCTGLATIASLAPNGIKTGAVFSFPN
ncbi:hypothetical protein OEG84_10445 [Hoeflea sp. G2-23]|jgi:hypothetical protein|uniref:Uncharacterized protein n=1 Tax=Hoeflea algicola TaxID=2983763 RepID=A0ABT3Z8N0_9HYPH|nr:hypothetical protein [Hoeflea algicola]MCY0148118.1 hypothetical protein [Hoeflea algicola]